MPLPMQEDLKGEEPTLNAEAGATAGAARVAHGFVDEDLHAGFIEKQTPLPPAEPGRHEGHPPLGVPPDVIEGLHLEAAVEREPSLNAEAGATEKAAAVAHGYADKDLHAGFISKQTPLH